MKEARVVYPIPADVAVERTADLTYQVREDMPLKLDLYRPASAPEQLPAVVFVHGDTADPEVVKDAKDWGQYVSWGELIVSIGLAAVTFNHRSAHGGTRMQDVMDDIGAALAFIEERADGFGIDQSRLAIFGISMGVPYAVCAAERDPKPRCVVAYYGPLDWSYAPLPASVLAASVLEFSPLHRLEAGAEFPPLLVVRAGQDHIPLLNESIDAFVVAALSKNLEVDLINHSEGLHGFDVRDASRRSQAVIASTLEFLQRRLLEQ